MNELCLHGLIHGKSKRIFYVIHNQIIACVQWYRVNIWKIYSVSKRKVFSRTDFAACRISCRNADPELYIPFFLEAAGIFRSVPFGNLWENRSRRNRLSFADSLDARWDFFPFSNLWFYCIWSPYGNYGDAFYRNWTGNRIFHVYSAVRTYRRRSCRSTSFPHYLIYLPLWDSVYQMVYRESMGIWRNHGIFPQKVSAYLLKVLLYTALYGVGILLNGV